ncbi:MAG: hypothetical protein ACREO4_06165 [Lysobacter sp.]
MAEKLANNRNKVASSPAAGLVVVNNHEWDVEVAASGDTVLVGELPAYHQLLPEASCLIFDGDAAAMTLDVCVEADANTVFNDSATLGSAFTRVACSTYELARTLGVSPVNRSIYLKLGTAVAAAGGKVIASIASYPVS